MKYMLTEETNPQGLHRIIAMKDIPFHYVKINDLGGWIEGEKNLSQDGHCWVDDNAMVYEDARIEGDAIIFENANIHGRVIVKDKAEIGGNVELSGREKIDGRTFFNDDVAVSDFCRVHDDIS